MLYCTRAVACLAVASHSLYTHSYSRLMLHAALDTVSGLRVKKKKIQQINK